MANLIITTVCNLKCPYCFAEQFLGDARHHAFISLTEFAERLDFLARSGIDEIRLIGGEPTLHPQFPEVIALARQQHKKILVFSNGVMPERALVSLETLPVEQCTVLINMNASRYADGPHQHEIASRSATIQRLGKRALLGFNIYSPAFELDFLLDYIQACQPSIRIGLAQPILNGGNRFLHPKQYRVVGARLAAFARRAKPIKLELDCGFVRCMFSDADLEVLHFEPRCNPILDIDLTGNFIHCFPLTGQVEMPADTALDASAVRAALDAQTSVYRYAGIYRECSSCNFKRMGECNGGCLAQTLRRFQHPPVTVTVPESVIRRKEQL